MADCPIDVSAVTGLLGVVLGFAGAHLIEKWKRKDDARSVAAAVQSEIELKRGQLARLGLVLAKRVVAPDLLPKASVRDRLPPPAVVFPALAQNLGLLTPSAQDSVMEFFSLLEKLGREITWHLEPEEGVTLSVAQPLDTIIKAVKGGQVAIELLSGQSGVSPKAAPNTDFAEDMFETEQQKFEFSDGEATG